MNPHPERAKDYLEHILDALERIQRYTAIVWLDFSLFISLRIT